jgi:hypothetical protein
MNVWLNLELRSINYDYPIASKVRALFLVFEFIITICWIQPQTCDAFLRVSFDD